MGEGDRKSVLIVEDNQGMLYAYKISFEDKGYDVTAVFYRGPQTEIPSERFDGAILDGLNGDYREVAGKIDSEKVIVVSGDRHMVRGAREIGLCALGKNNSSVDKVVEMLK